MNWPEEDFLQLSGLQHFAFCRRQWALIHIEKLWQENLLTVKGDLFHSRAHDERQRERRGDTLILRNLSVFSHSLGVSGQCDVVEFHSNPAGITLQNEPGLWLPYPVEYKRGTPKQHDADLLQLCAQAICLEEMLCCEITQGALFYGETRRRTTVDFSDDLRQKVHGAIQEMHQLFQKGFTPKAKPTKACQACSLKDQCLPKLQKRSKVSSYMQKAIQELENADDQGVKKQK